MFQRIHFSTRTFNMRMHLAVLDWVCMYMYIHIYMDACVRCLLLCFSQNENVNRAYTSTHMVADLRRPDRRTAMKVLVDKTYNFVDVVWDAYVERYKTDLRYSYKRIKCTLGNA